MDFTLKTYTQLIEIIQKQRYSFQTFAGFIQKPEARSIILRHDVDRLPDNALKIANIEKELEVRASYYFRVVKQSLMRILLEKLLEWGMRWGIIMRI